MNIAKLNPIGYEVQTDKGNKYKRSNIWKSVAAATIALDVFSMSASKKIKNPIAKGIMDNLGSKSFLETIEDLFKIKTPTKYYKPILAAVFVLSSVVEYWAGIIMDNITSNKRRMKADGVADPTSAETKWLNFKEMAKSDIKSEK